MTAQETNANFADLGRKAAEAWRVGDREHGKGDALAVYALFNAHFTKTFQCKVLDKKGNTILEDTFELEDYISRKGCVKADGTRDNKLLNARTNAVALEVFGLQEAQVTNAIKQRIQRALSVVAYFIRMGYDETNVELSRRNELMVPYPAMVSPPGDSASTNEQTRYKAMEGERIALDGKEGMTLAALNRRANPPVERHATVDSGNKADRGAEFVASVKFTRNILSKFMDENADDDMPALNSDARNALWELQTVLASYFEADPFEEEKKEAAPKKKAA